MIPVISQPPARLVTMVTPHSRSSESGMLTLETTAATGTRKPSANSSLRARVGAMKPIEKARPPALPRSTRTLVGVPGRPLREERLAGTSVLSSRRR